MAWPKGKARNAVPLVDVSFREHVRSPNGHRNGGFRVGCDNPRLGGCDSIELLPTLGLVAVTQGGAVRCYPLANVADLVLAADVEAEAAE